MIDDDIDEQPQATNTLTDFNDLHLQQGLDAVREQVSAAVDACAVPVFPAPLSTADSQIQGQSAENEANLGNVKPTLQVQTTGGQAGASNTGGQGGGQNPKLTDALARYAFINTTNDVFDYQNSRKFKLNSLKNELGKHYNAWLNSDDRKNIEPDEAEKLLVLHAGTQSPLMSKNCVLLRGEAAIYDLSLNRVISPQAAQMDYPKEYKNWLENPARLVVPYENLQFDPTRKIDIDPEYINTFRGYPMQPLKDENGKILDQPSAHQGCQSIVAMINSLCNGDLPIVRWLLQWLAYPLQNEGAKMHSAVLMASHIQGSGKSTLFEKVMGAIYGNYHRVLTSQQLENTHHNEWIDNVSFLFGEEIATSSNKYNITPYLNAIITAKEVSVNPKHRSAKQVPAYFNMAFASNATVPFPLEGESRRWLVIAPQSKLNEKLATAVHLEIASGGVQAFYTYLLNLPLDDFEHNLPPNTAAKQNLIESSKASVDFFFEQWAAGETKYKYCTCQTEQLYNAYKVWAGEDLEHKFSKRRFVTEAKKHITLFEIKERQHWRKPNHETGQSQLFIVGECPVDEVPIAWYGKGIVLFDEAILKGDVPHAKYAC